MKERRHDCSVDKGKQKYIFSFSKGSEHKTMSAMLDMIFDEKTDFDWCDSTIVAFEIIDQLVQDRNCREGLLIV